MDIFDCTKWTSPDVVDVADEMKRMLLDEATQLDNWADKAISGGWSTWQVGPMRRRANEIRARLVTLGVVK